MATVPVYVTTLAALKALDTTTNPAAVYNGSRWAFIAGNYTARVALDTVGGIYAKADAIATSAGSWVRQFTGFAAPEWFGAGGDGVADDTTALQTAINVLQAQGTGLLLGPTQYKISAALVSDMAFPIHGTRYGGDKGLVYESALVTQSTGYLASTIVCGTTHHGLILRGREAYSLAGFQVVYPSAPSVGIVGVYMLSPTPTALTGTVSVTSGTNTILGTGTLFTSELIPGQRIKIVDTGEIRTLGAITDNTHATLKLGSPNEPNWRATDASSAMQKLNANAYDVVRDVVVIGAYYGFFVNDHYDFTLDNCMALNCAGRGIVLTNTVWPSYSDGELLNCKWINNTLGGALIQAGGGYRFKGGKFNYGGTSSVGIEVAPSLNGLNVYGAPQQIEPLIFNGFSMEGCNQGIVFARTSGDTQVQQVAITGCQIWVGNHAIDVVTPGSAWVSFVEITGNTLVVSSASAPEVMPIGGVSGIIISGNTMESTHAGKGVTIGGNVDRAKQSGNSSYTLALDADLVSPTLPATTVDATNSNPYQVEVAIYGGASVTKVTVTSLGGTAVDRLVQAGAAVNGQFILKPGDKINVTYTGIAPTWTWRATDF